MLGALLERVPALTLLVTSRVPLRLIAEREVRISPFPAIASSDGKLEEASRSAALHRAGTGGRFHLRAGYAAFERIAAIVAQLDIRPLAIELAAARVRHFSLEEIQHPAIQQSRPAHRRAHATLPTASARSVAPSVGATRC